VLTFDELRQGLRHAARIAVDAVLPPICIACSTPVGAPGALCIDCWNRIDFLGPPHCHACGHPFELDPGAEALCGACLRERPVYDRARAVMRYDDASRRLILAFKHGDRTDAAPAFGRWLARSGAEFLADRAVLLAVAVGRATGAEVVPDALMRIRRTPSQGAVSGATGRRADRRRNVRRAFALCERRRHRIAGRDVVLIDDVLTTGATVSECARVLRAAGAATVNVLILARVVRPAS
jgi:predicted amidophosphoribosyltransferase